MTARGMARLVAGLAFLGACAGEAGHPCPGCGDAVDAARPPDGQRADAEGAPAIDAVGDPDASAGPMSETGLPTEAPCERAVAPVASNGGTIAVQFSATIGNAPLALGVDQPVPGGQVRLSALRFFLTHPRFWRAGAPVPTDLIDPAGQPLAYGVQLIDFETADSLTVRLRAQPGTYDALTFEVGLSSACNAIDPTTALFPLDTSGGMTWTWGIGYLCVKLEGKTGPAAPAATPFQAHGGGLPGIVPPLVTVDDHLTVQTGTPRTVAFTARLDEWVSAAVGHDDITAGTAVLDQIRKGDFLSVTRAP